jgi:hypothetical protein
MRVITYSSILLMGVFSGMFYYHGDMVCAGVLGLCACLNLFLAITAAVTDKKFLGYEAKQRQVYTEYKELLKQSKEKK